MTKKQRYLSRVSDLGCAICQEIGYGATPAQLHHPRFCVGLSERASDWLVIPLCREHHQGDTGFHKLGPAEFKRRYGFSEPELIAWTIERLQ